MEIPLFIILAVLPSILWLLFFLRRDKKPEPNKVVVKIFILGILATFAALVSELIYADALRFLSLQNILILTILGNSFIEEYFKYFVVKVKVLKSSEFDEPIDVMMYLIIASLGFAAAENIFLLSGLSALGVATSQLFKVILIRFLGAVLLHVFASGIVGYFLARSFLLKCNSSIEKKERRGFVFLGLILATCLHGIYNYIIINIDIHSELYIVLLIVLLSLSAIGIFAALKNLKKLKSICKI